MFKAKIFLFLLLAAGTGLGQTDYYVSTSGNDNNSGTSSASPIKTLFKASQVLEEGDRLLLKGGDVWTGEQLVVNDSNVVITSYGTGRPVISPGSGFDYGISLGDYDNADAVDSVTINNIEIKNTDLYGIEANGTRNSRFTNNLIHDIIDATRNPKGIALGFTSSKNIVEDNTIYNIYDTPSLTSGVGISIGTPADTALHASTKNYIRRNTIYNVGYGMVMWYSTASAHIVENNTIYDFGLIGVTSVGSVSTGNTIRYNSISRSGTVNAIGIQVWNNSIVAYNQIDSVYHAIEIHALANVKAASMNSGDNNQVYNNTANDIERFIRMRILGVVASNNTIKNNLANDVTTFIELTENNTTKVSNTIDYNNYYDASSNEFVANVDNFTFANWQAVTSQEANSVQLDPEFVSEATNNFRLKTGSPMINAGVSVGQTKDKAGNLLVGNPDIGAFETPVAGPTSSFIQEAELIPTLSNYVVEINGGLYSNNQGIKLSSTSGSATFSFPGSSGNYDLNTRYEDETDGEAKLAIYQNSVKLDSFVMNLNTGNLETESNVTDNYFANGDEVVIYGYRDGGEYARVDYLEFVAVQPPPPPNDPIIGNFTPTSGPEGQLVTINGSDFNGLQSVEFNNQPAVSFTLVSNFVITATVPVDATTGKITVTTNIGSTTSLDDFTVTTSSPPPGGSTTGGGVGYDGLTYTERRDIFLASVPAPSSSIPLDDRKSYVAAWLEAGLSSTPVTEAIDHLIDDFRFGDRFAMTALVSMLIKYGTEYGTGVMPTSQQNSIKATFENDISKNYIFGSGNPNKNIGAASSVYLYCYYFNQTITTDWGVTANPQSNWPTFTYNSNTYYVDSTYVAMTVMFDYIQWRMEDWYLGGNREFDSIIYHRLFVENLIPIVELGMEAPLIVKSEMVCNLMVADLGFDAGNTGLSSTIGRTDYRHNDRYPVGWLYHYFGTYEESRWSDDFTWIWEWEPDRVIVDAAVIDDESDSYWYWVQENHSLDGTTLKNDPAYGQWNFKTKFFGIGGSKSSARNGWQLTIRETPSFPAKQMRLWVNSLTVEPDPTKEDGWSGESARQFKTYLYDYMGKTPVIWYSSGSIGTVNGGGWDVEEVDSGINFYRKDKTFVAIETSSNAAGVVVAQQGINFSGEVYLSYSDFKSSMISSLSVSNNTMTTPTAETIGRTDYCGRLAVDDCVFPFRRMMVIESTGDTLVDWSVSDVMTVEKNGNTLTLDFTNWTINTTSGQGNLPPVLAFIPNVSVTAGDLINFLVTATDDSSSVAMTVTGTLHTGTSAFNYYTDNADDTGTFNWQTAAGDTGQSTITFVATDNKGQTDSQAMTITVNPQPVTPPPPTTGIAGHKYPRNKIYLFGTANWDWSAKWDIANIVTDGDTNIVNGIKAINPNTFIISGSDWNSGRDAAPQGNVVHPDYRTFDSAGNAINIYGVVQYHANFTDFSLRSTSFSNRLYWEQVVHYNYDTFDQSVFDGYTTNGLWTEPRDAEAHGDIDLDGDGTNDYTDPTKGVNWVNTRWKQGAINIVDSLNTLSGNRPLLLNSGKLEEEDDYVPFNKFNGLLIENKYSYGSIKFWRDNYAAFMAAGRTPHIFHLDGLVDDATDYRHVRYHIGMALFGDGYVSITNNGNHHRHFYYDEFEGDLGTPLGPAELVRSTGPNDEGVYVRFFQRGAMLLNAGDSNEIVAVADISGFPDYNGPHYKFKGGQDPGRNDGLLFSSITLSGGVFSPSGHVFGDAVLLFTDQYTWVAEIIMDSEEDTPHPGSDPPTYVGTWTETNSTTNGWWVSEKDNFNMYRARWKAAGTGTDTARVNPTFGHSGEYEVYEWHGTVDGQTMATNVPYRIVHAGGTATGTINQQTNTGQWNLLGTFNFNTGSGQYFALNDNANGAVIYDAVKFVHTGNSVITTASEAESFIIHVIP